MLTYSADLNSFGNPVIWGGNYSSQYNYGDPVNTDPFRSRLVIEKGAQNVNILIKPVSELTPDATYTNSNCASVIANLLGYLGLTATYDSGAGGFRITGNVINSTPNGISDVVDSGLVSNTFQIYFYGDNGFGGSSYIETQYLYITLQRATFVIAPEPCNECLRFAYSGGLNDYQNPLDNYGLGNRGIVEYQYQTPSEEWVSIGTSKVEGFNWLFGEWGQTTATAFLSYCHCDLFSLTPFRCIYTVREVPNCGGTSPIIYQSISDHFSLRNMHISNFPVTLNQTLFTSIPYKPSITYAGDFNCCVSQDKTITVSPETLIANIDSPHNVGSGISLKYDFYKVEGSSETNLLDSPTETQLKTDTITVSSITVTQGSLYVTGVDTVFTASRIIKGSTLFSSTGLKLGVVNSVDNDLNITLTEPAASSYTGSWKYTKFYFKDPTTTSDFVYTNPAQGSYKLVATYKNNCETVTKEWNINVCTEYLVVTGDCNNPKIQNISNISYLIVNLTTYKSMDVVDAITQTVIMKDVIVGPISSYEIPKLNDGFYKLTVKQLDSTTGLQIGDIDERILFYDCDIKSCEVALRSNLLGFDFCAECIDKKAKDLEYQELQRRNFRFQVQKEILYSYWDDLKYQQSIPDSWNIEDHTQELQTYTETLNKLKEICKDCGFTYSTNAVPLYSTGDCGCSK